MVDRLISPTAAGEDDEPLQTALRPRTLDEFIGQDAQRRRLSIALRVLCLVEFTVRRTLASSDESLAGLSAGQPRRATARPTSEALLRAFRGTNLVLLPSGPGPPRHVTPLSALQERILALLELPDDTYSRLSFAA